MISLSKLDLSFLKDPSNRLPPAPPRPARPRGPRSDLPAPYFVPDVDAAYGGSWKSIIDGSEISSRSNWREHNKRNGVVDVGDKYWGESENAVIRGIHERMEFDPSAVGNSDDFSWNDPAI